MTETQAKSGAARLAQDGGASTTGDEREPAAKPADTPAAAAGDAKDTPAGSKAASPASSSTPGSTDASDGLASAFPGGLSSGGGVTDILRQPPDRSAPAAKAADPPTPTPGPTLGADKPTGDKPGFDKLGPDKPGSDRDTPAADKPAGPAKPAFSMPKVTEDPERTVRTPVGPTGSSGRTASASAAVVPPKKATATGTAAVTSSGVGTVPPISASPVVARASVAAPSAAGSVSAPAVAGSPLRQPTGATALVTPSRTGSGAHAVGAARVSEAVRSARATVAGAASRGPRRARLHLKRIDPWSVMKFAFAVSLVLFVVAIVATSVLYLALDAMDVFTSINKAMSDITGEGGGAEDTFKITAKGVIGTAVLLGAVNMVLFTALMTLGAFVYNVCADLVGGVELTLSEKD
jgi:hypothetical protein